MWRPKCWPRLAPRMLALNCNLSTPTLTLAISVLFAAIPAAPASIVQDEQMLMSFPVWP